MADSGCETVYFWKNVPLTGYFIETSTPPLLVKRRNSEGLFFRFANISRKINHFFENTYIQS